MGKVSKQKDLKPYSQRWVKVILYHTQNDGPRLPGRKQEKFHVSNSWDACSVQFVDYRLGTSITVPLQIAVKCFTLIPVSVSYSLFFHFQRKNGLEQGYSV